MYLFVLGRQPEIAMAELEAVFGGAELILPNVALVESKEEPDIGKLGGTRKIGRVIYDNDGNPKDFLLRKFSKIPSGKITLGVSHYGKSVSEITARKSGVFIKKNLNRSVRILPNSTAEISDAASLGNKLGKSPNKIELLMAYISHRLIIAELIGVQDLNSYTLRDRGRPKRDARVGMLPPKLAQIMINLAVQSTNRPMDEHTIVDPFCGTGVVLQEAMLMGYSVYGTDKEPRMIEYTKTNLDWLKRMDLANRPTDQQSILLEVGNATEHKWQQPIDFVVSEVYLGQPYATEPPMDKLRENMNTCNLIVEKFLENIIPQLKPKTPIVLAIPAWFVGGKTYHLPIVKKLGLTSNSQLTPSKLIYRREDQIVGRELVIIKS